MRWVPTMVSTREAASAPTGSNGSPGPRNGNSGRGGVSRSTGDRVEAGRRREQAVVGLLVPAAEVGAGPAGLADVDDRRAQEGHELVGPSRVGEQAADGPDQLVVVRPDRADGADGIGVGGVEDGDEPGVAAFDQLLVDDVGRLEPRLGPGRGLVLDLDGEGLAGGPDRIVDRQAGEGEDVGRHDLDGDQRRRGGGDDGGRRGRCGTAGRSWCSGGGVATSASPTRAPTRSRLAGGRCVLSRACDT